MNSDYYVNLQDENELKLEQKVLFNYYFQFLSIRDSKGIYSCNFKQDNWDTRIVDLENNELYRFSFPDFTKDPQNLDNLRKIFSSLQEYNLASIVNFGIAEEQLWYERKLFHSKNLLTEILKNENNVSTFLNILIDVLYNVKSLWEHNVYHGNICTDNIVFDDNKYIVIDPVFSYLFQNNKFPTSEDDVLGLKNLIQNIASLKNCPSLDAISESVSDLNLSLAIFKINEIKKSIYSPLSSGVIIKKGANVLVTDESANNENNHVKPSIPSGNIINDASVGNENNIQYNNYNNYNHKNNNNSQNFLRDTREYQGKNNSTFILYFLILILLGMIAYYGKDKIKGFSFTRDNEKIASYEYSWNTGQPVLMKEVLTQALDGDLIAQSVIVNFAFDSNKNSNYVDRIILKTIFNPLWENSLTDDDRYTALRLGLSKLVSFEDKKVPLKTLNELHPSIALAVAGSVNLDAKNSQLGMVTLDYMSSLPSFYGSSFKELKILGGQNLDELQSRALSSMLVIGGNDENIASFLLDSIGNQLALRGKLYILLELLNQNLIKFDTLYSVVDKLFRKPLGDYLAFFNTNDWKSLNKLDMLNIIVGKMPSKQLEILQYIDLLSYPDNKIKKASAQILKSSKKLNSEMLDYIANGDSKLSREQVYILMSLFLIEGDKQHAIIDKFLSTNPDVKTSLNLLLFRGDENQDDLFNFEVSRYLSHQDLKLSQEEIMKLLKHSEPMARAIGYSNLDITNPKHKAYLEKMRKKEKSDLLKVLIAKRLE